MCICGCYNVFMAYLWRIKVFRRKLQREKSNNSKQSPNIDFDNRSGGINSTVADDPFRPQYFTYHMFTIMLSVKA